jgi:hypothetical protein
VYVEPVYPTHKPRPEASGEHVIGERLHQG